MPPRRVLDIDAIVDVGDASRGPGGGHCVIVRGARADRAGKDHQPAGAGLDREPVRVQHGIAPERAADGVGCGTRIGSLGQGDGVADANHPGDARGAGLGCLALVVPLHHAGQGDEAVPGLRIDGHRHRALQHQRLQHVAAQVLVVALVPVRDLHPQFIGDPGDPANAGRGVAPCPLVAEAGHGPAQRDHAAGGRYLDRRAIHLRIPAQFGGDVAPQVIVRHGSSLSPLAPASPCPVACQGHPARVGEPGRRAHERTGGRAAVRSKGLLSGARADRHGSRASSPAADQLVFGDAVLEEKALRAVVLDRVG